jgi:anaerobic selenocysteine-containing dehydrogenase
MATQTFRTMCPMNCHPTLCGMLVEVDEGKVASVKGDPENPDSQGFLCVRGHAAQEIIGNPDRVLYPMVRARRGEAAWRRASWDEVLERMAERMRAVGSLAVGTWTGHGTAANNYGTRLVGNLVRRFSNLYGCQGWSATMICWGLGAFGLGLTGVLETNTKEDMSAHAKLIVLWGANLASQPNTARHVAAARRRGAHVITVDVRQTEASAQSDETLVVRPGTDAALALAVMHVIVKEQLHDGGFVQRHTVGFDALAGHVEAYSPAWGEGVTGVAAARIVAFARRYATTKPAMIVIGGSSMYKGANGWQAGRAIACLPALTGNLGIPGGGFGPRHGANTHGQGLASVAAMERRKPGDYIPNQMPRITEALQDGRIRVMLLWGTNMVSSFADTRSVVEGLRRCDLVTAYDLFMSDTARECADIVLPATSWLEELGMKSTNTHLYLMPQVLDPPGETRPASWILQELARRLGVDDFFPWESYEAMVDTVLDHPGTGHATVAAIRAEGGIHPLPISHVAHPTGEFHTLSGKVEFLSERAAAHGLPALPVHEDLPGSPYPLVFRQGRTLTQFHGFYDHGRALPSLAKADPEPVLWIAPADAAARGVVDGAAIRIHNERGELSARARVTDRIPAGTVWMRDGWRGLNDLTSGRPIVRDDAVDLFEFAAGQSAYDARVDVTPSSTET